MVVVVLLNNFDLYAVYDIGSRVSLWSREIMRETLGFNLVCF